MALYPVAFIAANYTEYPNWWLKVYEIGTTTPKTLFLDSDGNTSAAKLELNIDGFLKSSGGALVTPYIDDSYDAWIFPTEAEADANDTSNALRVADNMDPLFNFEEIVLGEIVITFDNIAALRANNKSNIFNAQVRGYYSVGDGGGGPVRYLDSNDITSVDNGGSIIVDVLNNRWKFISKDILNIKWFGAQDSLPDNYTAIQATIDAARITKNKVFCPAEEGQEFTEYDYSSTLEYGSKDIIIEGASMAVALNYTGVGTAIAININAADTTRERCGLRNIQLKGENCLIGFDVTGVSYGNFQNFQTDYNATNAVHIYAMGRQGTGPYYNSFDAFSMTGSADKTQTGFKFLSDGLGFLADGPNGNEVSNVKRIASFARGFDIQAGGGNLFTNISGESISDAFIILNDRPDKESGTSTGFTSTTLTDTSKTWSTSQGDPLNFINDGVEITSGVLSGESRRVNSNTVDTLTLDKPWPEDPGAGATYRIVANKALKNMFVNMRQEGLASDNPDGIVLKLGARGNEFSQMDIGSLGSGVLIDDQTGDPTNKVRQGDLIVNSFTIENPGPSASIEVVPRNSTFGGLRSGSRMILEYIDIQSPNFVAGSAEAVLTVDHGGAATGTGTPSLVAKIDDFNTRSAFKPNYTKTGKTTGNNGIFINLTTNANVNAAADFIINVAYQVD